MPSPLPIIRQRHERRDKRQRSASQRLLLVVLGAGFLVSILLALGIFGLAMAWSGLTAGLPPVGELPALLDPEDGLLLQPTRLYDRSGEHLIAELAPPGIPRRYVPLTGEGSGHLPQFLADATLAAADPSFRSHPGCLLNNQPTLARRLASDLLLWRDSPAAESSGASTLSADLRACLVALQITDTYGRDQVLEWYLNSADYGNHAYGADAAARLYFGRPAAGLDLAESALLAAVSQSPALNPFDAPQAAIPAQRELLSRMAVLGLVSPSAAQQAAAEQLQFAPPPSPPGTGDALSLSKGAGGELAPAFVALALDQLSGVFPRERLERGGLNITTSLDYDLQAEAACLTQMQVAHAAGASPEGLCTAASSPSLGTLPPGQQIDASAVVTDPATGQVLALVGDTGPDGSSSGLQDHPAGSLVSPFIYLTAFTRGASPASLVWDIPGGAGLPLEVQGSGESFHGPVQLREAMAGDYLVPAAQTLESLGGESVAQTAAPFGLDLQPDLTDPLSLLTGDQPVSPLDVAQAYGIFAADGILAGQMAGETPGLSAVLKVEGSDRATWLDWTVPQKQAVVSGPLAFLVNNVLSDTSARAPALGSSSPLQLDRPAAARLGRTLDGRDAWAVGYTPQRSVAVWTGADSPLPPDAAMGLWHALAEAASRGLPAEGWAPPAGITAMEVCDPSGLLPTPACPSLVKEYFLTGSEPVDPDSLYAVYPVNRETGFLATVFTPLELVDPRTYMLIPDAARGWAASAGLPVPPEAYDTIQYTPPGGEVSILSPEMFAEVSGEATVTGSAAGEGFLLYRLQYGAGLNPGAWFQIGEDVTTPVTAGKLGEWDTTGLEGLYVLQLQVIYLDQTLKTASVVVDTGGVEP
jgi:membrane peptidoglycan carboxypeptidase